MKDKLYEFLGNSELKITSSWQELDKAVKKLSKAKNINKKDEIFQSLKFILHDNEISVYTLDQFILNNIKVFKELTNKSELVDIKEYLIKSECIRKQKAIQELADKKRIEAVMNPEEDYVYFRDEIIYKTCRLFLNKFDVDVNEADIDFYSCFQLAGKNIIFKNDSITKLLLYKLNGDLDIKGELLSSSDENNLADEINKSFRSKYNTYMKALLIYLKGVTEADLNLRINDDNNQDTIGFLESIFVKGFDYEGEHYVIPSSFRHFLELKIEKKKQNIDGENAYVFNGIKVFPADEKLMPTLEFENFLDFFSKNFHKLTRHCLTNNKEWKTFSNSAADAALCYYPIPTDWKDAEIPASWKKFFDGKARERILHRIYFYIGACLDANNVAQQTLIISDDGGTGKGELIRILKEILPEGMMTGLSNAALTNDRFAVTAYGLYKAHILVNSEYDGKNFNSNLMKQITGGDTITAEIKNGAELTWNAAGTKVILTSNRTCYLTEHAIRRRVIPASFKANFNPLMGMDKDFHDELVRDGHDFLKYCWKIYQKSPLRRKDGSYIVLNPEQEKVFYKNKTLGNDDWQLTLLKAFSRDADISEKFYSGDYDENGSNDDYQEMYDTLFESASENSFIYRADLVNQLSDIFKNYLKYPESLHPYLKLWALKFDFNQYNLTLNQKELSKFYKFLEAKGHPTKQKGEKKYRAFMALKLKDIKNIIKESRKLEEDEVEDVNDEIENDVEITSEIDPHFPQALECDTLFEEYINENNNIEEI